MGARCHGVAGSGERRARGTAQPSWARPPGRCAAPTGATMVRHGGEHRHRARSGRHERVHPRYSAAWNACDTAAMAELVTEDIVWADPALPQPARGVAEVQEFMRASFRGFPDLQFGEPDEPAGCRVRRRGVLGVVHGGHAPRSDRSAGLCPDGSPDAVDGVDQWTMRDGRICAVPRVTMTSTISPASSASCRRQAAQRSAGWSRCSACRRGSGEDERRARRAGDTTSRSSARAPPAAPPRGCSPSAARASR